MNVSSTLMNVIKIATTQLDHIHAVVEMDTD